MNATGFVQDPFHDLTPHATERGSYGYETQLLFISLTLVIYATYLESWTWHSKTMTTFKLSNSTMDEASVLQHKMKRQKKPIQEDVDKPKRKRITPEQFCLLTELFQETDTPSHEIREALAKKLDMTNREVQVWFQNRRAKVNRSRLQEREQQSINPHQNKKVKFNYWSSSAISNNSSSSSSLASSPSLPHELIFHPDVTPIDILATAAAYVQQWDENEMQRKRKQQVQHEEQPKKHKSWRPWL